MCLVQHARISYVVHMLDVILTILIPVGARVDFLLLFFLITFFKLKEAVRVTGPSFKAFSHQVLHSELWSPAELCTIKCCGQLKSRKRNSVCETGKWKLSFLIALQTRVSAPLRETKQASLSNYHHLHCSIDVSFVCLSNVNDWWQFSFRQILLGITLQMSCLICIILCHNWFRENVWERSN